MNGLPKISSGEPLDVGADSLRSEELVATGIDFKGIWQVTSMSLGVGVFTIPHVFNSIGILHGCIWLLVCAFFADYGMQRLLDLAASHRISSYKHCADAAFGKCGSIMLMVTQIVTPCIGTLSYCSATRELFSDVLVGFTLDFDVATVPSGVEVWSPGKMTVVLILQMLVFLPTNVNTTMDAHTGVAQRAVWAVFIVVLFFIGYSVMLLARGCGSDALCGQRPPLFTGSISDVLVNVATLAFSFSMVWCVFPCTTERSVGDDLAFAASRMRHCIRWSVIICVTIFISIGLLGSLTLGSAAKPFALDNLSMNSAVQLIGLLVVVAMTQVCSVIALPIFQTLDIIGIKYAGEARIQSLRPWFVLVVGLVFAIIDAFVPTATLFALTGSIGLSTAAYIMPCLFFLRIGQKSTLKTVLAAACVIFGFTLLLVATPAVLLAQTHGHKSSSPQKLLPAVCPKEPVFAI